MSVIEFPKNEIGYWACHCGCMTHHVRSDGNVECANCGDICSEGYYLALPEGIVRDTAGNEPEPFTVKFHDGNEFACKRFAERLAAGEFNVVIGVRNDGRVGTIAPEIPETPEQRRWLRRRLRDAYEMLRGRNVHI